MKIKRALIGFIAITVTYLTALIWADTNNQVFSQLPALISVLPVLAALSFVSYLVRYLRWRWLLNRAGQPSNAISGFLAYLAGFAFTATPGKVGELVRIRYLKPQGIAPEHVVSVFVFERALDLIVVLLLSSLAIQRTDLFIVALAFVTSLLTGLLWVIFKPSIFAKCAAWSRLYKLVRMARLLQTLHRGITGCRRWLTPVDTLVSLLYGLIAWTITAFSFVWLLNLLDISVPFVSAFSIYPMAMLAGAASMLPGGIGSTELTIVGLLSLHDITIQQATMAAVGIRLASMWFSVACGFISIGILETQNSRKCND